MKERIYNLKCIVCSEEWNSTYRHKKYTCPFCEMPVSEMARDIFQGEGFGGIPFIINIILKRIKYAIKHKASKRK